MYCGIFTPSGVSYQMDMPTKELFQSFQDPSPEGSETQIY